MKERWEIRKMETTERGCGQKGCGQKGGENIVSQSTECTMCKFLRNTPPPRSAKHAKHRNTASCTIVPFFMQG
jgi:hypothetical protein